MNKGYGLILYLFIFENSIFARKLRDFVLFKKNHSNMITPF